MSREHEPYNPNQLSRYAQIPLLLKDTKPLTNSMSCISHPLIKPDSLESREYQLSIAMKALDA